VDGSIEDMLAILFPHMFEDLEYLLPEDEMQVDGPNLQLLQGSSGGHVNGNAVAGPSRLR
jgi:E3 ubiquitin-protein ligase SHPRH